MIGREDYQRIELAEIVERFPKTQRGAIVQMAHSSPMPARELLPILAQLRWKPVSRRREVIRLVNAGNIGGAIELARQAIPSPDPRIALLRQAEKSVLACIKAFPNDPEVRDLQQIAERIGALHQDIERKDP